MSSKCSKPTLIDVVQVQSVICTALANSAARAACTQSAMPPEVAPAKLSPPGDAAAGVRLCGAATASLAVSLSPKASPPPPTSYVSATASCELAAAFAASTAVVSGTAQAESAGTTASAILRVFIAMKDAGQVWSSGWLVTLTSRWPTVAPSSRLLVQKALQLSPTLLACT